MSKKIILFPIIALLAMSCEVEEMETVESVLEAKIFSDEYLGLDEFDDGDNLDYLEYGEISDDQLSRFVDDYYPSDSLRFKFKHEVTSHTKTVEFEYFGDTTIVSTINHNVLGNFITVVFDSMDTSIDTLTKPFDINAQRKIRFVRVDDSGRHRRDWQLDAITPVVSFAGVNVGIDSLKILNAENDSILYSFSSDDMGDIFISRDNIPEFTMGDSLKILMTVYNLGPDIEEKGETCLMRIGRGRRHQNPHHHMRRKLFDDGDTTENGDEISGDDTFTRLWKMHPPGLLADSRVFKVIYRVIDYETLYTSEGGYHSSFWGFPYKVNRD
tara:strand:+ start:2457 stop:3437 length:981 start_codon:yes stop_codon:yes gene_type:complete